MTRNLGGYAGHRLACANLVAGGTLVAAAAGTLATLAWLWHRSHFGLDLTDESFDLIWLEEPWRYPLSPTQFGFVYHPLYDLVSGDIAAIRQANLLLTFCLAWALCTLLITHIARLSEHTARPPRISQLIVSASLATSALAVFTMWIPTPSYNSLALQAVILAASGLILADKSMSFASVAGWLLVGAGGWLAFMAKPPTAAVLLPIAITYLAVSGNLNGRLLSISAFACTLLLLGSAVSIDGSVQNFAHRLAGGLEISRVLEGGHRIDRLFRIDRFALTAREQLLLSASAILVFALSVLANYRWRYRATSSVGCMGAIIASLAIVSEVTAAPLYPGNFMGMLALGGALGALTAAVWLARTKSRWSSIRRAVPISLTLAALPYAYAFGTGNNYWQQGAGAAMFWVLSGAALLASVLPQNRLIHGLLPTAVVGQLTTVVLLATAMEHPYRQSQALRLQDEPTTLGRHEAKLVLPRQTAEYFRTVTSIAKSAGFQRGTPVFDLTGHSPGTVFALGASAVGQPWMIGGYKGSERLASMMLDRASCPDISKAWVLTEPEGPRKLDTSILRRFGIDFRRDYVEVGALFTPLGIRDYPAIYEQRLLKPTRPANEAIAACREARGR